MSGIQSLLAIGAVWLFALVTINFNSTVVHNISIEVENKVYLTAFSLADDMIEEIKQKAFDESTSGKNLKIVALSSLAHWDTLRFDSGESWPNFDDIDDYNNYNKTVHDASNFLEDFNVSTKVYYVNESTPEIKANYRTYYKRVDVTVSSAYLQNPIQLSFIFSMHSKLKEV